MVLHVDLDAYFCSVEERERPDLKGKPLIVGGPANKRGVVAACNYPARKFGVRSAMPSSTAVKLCPQAIFLPPRIDFYRRESEQIMAILALPGCVLEKMSIDEAYVDISNLLPEDSFPDVKGRFEAAREVALHLKERIRAERKLTASIGVASNKLLAKIGSDFNKPDGLTVVDEATKAQFLRPMGVRTLYGVGPVTEKTLAAGAIRTIGDLQDYKGDLRALVGSFAEELREFAFGRDDRPVDPGGEAKSISSEETFDLDTTDRKFLRQCLAGQARELETSLKGDGLFAQTVQVKVRYSNFETLTRQVTSEDYLQDWDAIYRLACFLMAKHRLVTRPIRLLGLTVSSLSPTPPLQLKLSI